MRARYLYAKGLAYEQGEEPDHARRAYATLIKEDANSGQAHAARVAMVYLDHAAGRSAAVIDAYPKLDAKTLDKTQRRDLALIYAEALYAADRPADAADAYGAAIKSGVDRKQVAGKLLDLALRLDRHDMVLDLTTKPVPGVEADLLPLLRAEAHLAKGRWKEAAAEAGKVPANGKHAPRAAFARARALLKLGRTEQAIDPLKRAVAGPKNPPISARVALTDCLVRHKRTDEASRAIAETRKAVDGLSKDRKKEQDQWRGRLALLAIQLASDRGEHARVAEEIQRQRSSLPAKLLPQATYMRLHALHEMKDHKAALATMREDLKFLAGSEYDAPAVSIYADTLRAQKKIDALRELLEAFVKRQPGSPQAANYRLELAQMAQDSGDDGQAVKWLDQVLSDRKVQGQVQGETVRQARYNRALLAVKRGRPEVAVSHLAALLRGKPDDALRAAALVQLGEAHLAREDRAKAAEAWAQAVAISSVADRDSLRARLGRLRYALEDHEAACAQFAAAAKSLGGTGKLSPASRRAYARALAETGSEGEAADLLGGLFRETGDAARAFEAGLLLERAGEPARAEPWYVLAQKQKASLPDGYGGSVDASVARVRLAGGIGDRGAAYWLGQLAPEATDSAFAPAAAALRKIARVGALSPESRKKLAAAAGRYGPDKPRRYSLAAAEALTLWRSMQAGEPWTRSRTSLISVGRAGSS